MALRRTPKSRPQRMKYVNHLMELSSMPNKERQRWVKLVPHMTAVELGNFQDILEKEITDLAGIYLKVLERKAESRPADLEVEYGAEALDIDTSTVHKYFDAAPTVDENIFDLSEDPEERAKASSILEYLVKHASFIPDSRKDVLLETIGKLPLIVIQDLQAVVIREGLRELKRRKFHRVAQHMIPSAPSSAFTA